MSYAYTVTLSSEDGYDGDFLRLSSETEELADGSVVYRFTEPAAWAVAENVQENPHAFLTCCGSESLAEALIRFLGRIV